MRRPRGLGTVDSITCRTCGLSRFSTLNGLFSHQRSSRCHRRQTYRGDFVRTASHRGEPISAAHGRNAHASPTNETIPENVPVPEDHGGGASPDSRDERMRNEPDFAVGNGGSREFDLYHEYLQMPCEEERDGNPPLRPFDSTFHLVNFMRNCKNGQGLSRHDMRALLDLLLDDHFDLKALTVRTADDIEKYEEKELFPSSDGWIKHTFSEVAAGDVDLYYRDPIRVLTSLFSSTENKEDFKFGPTCERSNNGERIFTTPDTAYWWSHMQDFINLQCEGAVIAALIFYSDQTCLSNNTRIHGYPLVMSLGNIACGNRRDGAGHELLAVLPTFQGSNLSHVKKMEYFHDGLKIVLKSLKEASFVGVTLIDPHGSPQIVYPLLYAYICDHPESCKITASYDTNTSQSPCSVCMCGKDNLSDVGMHFQVRTELKMKEVYTAMMDLPPSLAEEMSKAWSLHPVECALWGFNGGDTRMGNPYPAVHVDVLHQSDLGVFKMIVGIIRDIASMHPRANKLKELDRRLLYIKQNFRYPAFRIPGNEQGGYFQSNANFAGFEHRAIMQVIVVCLVGLFEDDVVRAVVLFLEWYSIACRSSSHTSDTLEEMDHLMYRVVEALKQTMIEWQRSNFNTAKIHNMSHFSECIKRSGLPWEYSTDMYEQFHIALMKSAYRSSNKRQATPQIVRHNKRLQALRKLSKQSEGIEQSVKVQETSLKKAMKGGYNVLSPAHANIHRSWLLGRAGRDITQTPRASNADLRNRRGFDFAHISIGIQKLLQAQPEISQELLQALRLYELRQNVTISQVLGWSKTLAIPPGAGDKYGNWPMFGRASYKFHGRSYFTNVAYEVQNGGIRQSRFGQMRLLFHGSSQSNGPGVQRCLQVPVQLAFLKLYTEAEEDNWSVVTKCTNLRWATQASLRDVQNSVRTNSEADLRGQYLVVDIRKILRVVHVTPNFVAQGRFWVNRWKF